MLEKGGLLYMVLIPTIKGPMVEKRIHGGAKGTSVIVDGGCGMVVIVGDKLCMVGGMGLPFAVVAVAGEGNINGHMLWW